MAYWQLHQESGFDRRLNSAAPATLWDLISVVHHLYGKPAEPDPDKVGDLSRFASGNIAGFLAGGT